MGQSAIMAAIAARNSDAMRAAIVGELVPVIPSDTDPQTWDPRELTGVGGNIWQAVIWQEKLWFLDPDDTTTDHDAITCIVTIDSSRYKTNDVRVPYAVLSRSVNDPPDLDSPGPEYGDAYIVPAAATGDWATHDDEIAVWTARGWAYVEPTHGYLVYVEDEEGFYHFSVDDAWEAGTGAFAVPDNSIAPRHLLIRAWAAENQTTNAPPATGPAGETYIIGSSPTGAWAGNALKIAYRPSTNAAFVILSPFVGEQVYDKNLNGYYKWSGTAWIANNGAWLEVASEFTAANSAPSPTSSTAYSYSPTSAPTTSNQRVIDAVTITYAAKAAGTRNLRFRWSADVFMDYAGSTPSGDNVVALYRDSETNAIAWSRISIGEVTADVNYHESAEFLVSAPDASSHVYRIAILVRGTGGDAVVPSFSRRLFTLEEKR